MAILTTRRRLFTGTAAALAASYGVSPALAQTGFTVLALGDWGRRGQDNQREVAIQMAKTAAAARARAVLAVGDNFYDDGVTSVTDTHWKESFENVYPEPSLQIPWWVALGNHDYGGDPDAQVAYSRVSRRWKMPARTYQTRLAHAGVSVDLFVLDTTPMIERYTAEDSKRRVEKTNLAEQVAWLDRGLAASKADWRIVVGHHPVFSGGRHGDTPELVERVLPILRARNVTLYVNGHDHDMQLIERDGMHFACVGAGSKVREVKPVQGTVFCAATPGFGAIEFRRNGVTLSFIDTSGAQRYRAEIA